MIRQSNQARLAFLARVVRKEALYLQETDQRLFAELTGVEALHRIESDPLLAERLEAFVGRFGRLQDTLADKLLPALLDAMAEQKGPAVENLDRAERFGWIESVEAWLEVRRLRNLMVHEYIEDRVVLFDALSAGHAFVPVLLAAAERFARLAVG